MSVWRDLQRCRLINVALAMLVSSISGAQASHNGVAIGDGVRFNVAGIPGSMTDKNSLRCEGRVQRLLLDTVFVGPEGYCATKGLSPSVVVEAQLEKRRGSRTSHMLEGVLLGGIVGGIVGGLIAGDGCRKGGCDDGGLAVTEYMLAGLLSGSSIGAGIGLALPAGRHWRPIPPQFVVRLEFPR